VLPSNLINKLDHVASLYYTVNLRLDHAEEEIRRLRDDVHVVQRDIANLVARMAALEERLNTARAEMRTEFTQVVAEMQIAVVKAQAAKPALPPEATS
jgi:predicted  nucleic acid-binding Zn-ribbon protein